MGFPKLTANQLKTLVEKPSCAGVGCPKQHIPQRCCGLCVVPFGTGEINTRFDETQKAKIKAVWTKEHGYWGKKGCKLGDLKPNSCIIYDCKDQTTW